MTHREYYLICLMEECAEVQKAIAKMLRFGDSNFNPEIVEAGTNKDVFERECVDVVALLGKLSAVGYDTGLNNTIGTYEKLVRLNEYTNLSETLGIVKD